MYTGMIVGNGGVVPCIRKQRRFSAFEDLKINFAETDDLWIFKSQLQKI